MEQNTTKGYITVKKHADTMHRVMDHASKCSSVHGHCYLYELTFEYDQLLDLGYSIDFNELKRVGVQWIEDHIDHGSVLNPHDKILIDACHAVNSKLWLMSLNGEGMYCNPSVENIIKEVFLAMEILFSNYNTLRIHQIRMFETPQCYADCYKATISDRERSNFNAQNMKHITTYREAKGVVEYDQRKMSV